MRATQAISRKIYTAADLVRQIRIWKLQDKKIVFTNGVFDILHHGHLASLSEAASYGDMLIVAVNADASVKRLKGDSRPVNDEQYRALLLASLLHTDAVIIFEEDTPLEIIRRLMPDVLVKGGDYTIDQVAGAKEVIAAGGEVKIAGMVAGVSTTGVIERIQEAGK